MKFVWTEKCQDTFQELKDRITSAEVLQLAQNTGRFRVEVDACEYATGAVLMQEQDNVY